MLTRYRYTLLQKNENNATDKLKLRSENDAQSTSSSSRQPSSKMKRHYRLFNKATDLLPMNVSCFDTRTLYSSASCLRKVYINLYHRLFVLTLAGIDVQAELQMKTGSPTLGFQHPAANIPQIPPPQPPLQRTAMHRHQARRSGTNFLPKLAPGQSNNDMAFQGSPQGHPTPSSHASSPTTVSTRSPMVIQQGGNNTPPTSTVLAQPQMQQYHNFARSSQKPPNAAFQQRQQMSPNAQRSGPPSSHLSNQSASNHSSLGASMSTGLPGGNAIPASQFYPSPFQKHIDQLGKFTPTPLIELCSS